MVASVWSQPPHHYNDGSGGTQSRTTTVHLQVMDEADGLQQTCRVGVNILNKQLQIGTKWCSSCLGFG